MGTHSFLELSLFLKVECHDMPCMAYLLEHLGEARACNPRRRPLHSLAELYHPWRFRRPDCSCKRGTPERFIRIKIRLIRWLSFGLGCCTRRSRKKGEERGGGGRKKKNALRAWTHNGFKTNETSNDYIRQARSQSSDTHWVKGVWTGGRNKSGTGQ